MLNNQAHGVISIEDNLKCRLKNYKDLESDAQGNRKSIHMNW